MHYIRVDYDDINNGPGVRAVLWVTGCIHKCKGCHNPQTWNKDGGVQFTDDVLSELIEYLGQSYVDGVTISGGDPLSTFNREELCYIVRTIKNKLPNKSIWVYTGYEWEELIKSLTKNQLNDILQFVDVVIDGQFVEELKVDDEYRGSSNQRLINIEETQLGAVELWKSKFMEVDKVIEVTDVNPIIKVRFTNEQYEIERHGACWDLRAAEDYKFKAGDFFYLDLGINIQLPEGCWGLLAPRSSTFKRYGLIQTNSIGIIENDYCGNEDVWMLPVYALKDGEVKKGERVAQFTPMSYYPDVVFNVVDDMNTESRGGWGSTGTK